MTRYPETGRRRFRFDGSVGRQDVLTALLAIVCGACFLVACRGPRVLDAAPLGSATPTVTAFPEPTALPTATRTSVPTDTPEPSPTPTRTPRPTPSSTPDVPALRSALRPTVTPAATPEETATVALAEMPAALPSDFWNDVPIMPGARWKRDIDGTLTYTAPASLAEVRSFYRQAMVDAGWRSTSEVTTDDEAFTMMVFEKGDANVGVSISVLSQGLSFVTLGLY